MYVSHEVIDSSIRNLHNGKGQRSVVGVNKKSSADRVLLRVLLAIGPTLRRERERERERVREREREKGRGRASMWMLMTEEKDLKTVKLLPGFGLCSLNVKEPRITCFLTSWNFINFV
jgi:hypothetical protein